MEKMAINRYINSIPNQRQDVIQELARLTSSSTVSVYRWINGQIIPPLVKQKIIAEYLKVDIETLFPQVK